MLYFKEWLYAEASWPQEWADKVLQRPAFKAWLASLGIIGRVGEPKEGGVGRAYPVSTNKEITHYIKFTTDTREASAAAILSNQESPHHAKIYGVLRIGTFESAGAKKPLYCIVMEALNTDIGKKHRLAGQAVYTYLDHHPEGITDIKQAVQEAILTLKRKYQQDPDIIRIIQEIMQATYNIYKQKGVLSQDQHGANIALKQRRPALFDFGRSSIDYDHPNVAGARISSLH